MRNYYAGQCSICLCKVNAHEGYYLSGSVQCPACSEKVRSAPSVIYMNLNGAKISIKPMSFLGEQMFDEFRAATAGATYDPVQKCQVVEPDQAFMMIETLRGKGFIVDTSPEVTATLQAKANGIVSSMKDAATRADKTDELLRARGLYLYGFQKTGIQWLASRDRALLADEMGLGKTIQALVALPEGCPVLLIAPAVAKGVWAREFAKWRPEFKITTLSGRGSFRWPEPGEVVVVNYEILPDVPGTPPGSCVVLADEAHMLKSYRTSRSKSFTLISEAVRNASGKVWLLTATPLMNRPPELWSVLSSAGMAKEAFSSWGNFLTLFKGHQDRWGAMIWGSPDAEKIKSFLQRVSLRRTREEVLPDLPTKIWRDLPVNIDLKTTKICDHLCVELDKMGFQFDSKDLNEVGFKKLSRVRAALAMAKVPALIELVEQFEEQEEPMVVFSAHLGPIELLGKREGWACITGETPAEKRTEIENDFQAGKLRGIAATIRAGGVAITLTRASNAIFVDLEWTPALNSQAEDRVCRIGQSRGVVITRLIGNHWLDGRIFHLLGNKQTIIDESVGISTRTEGFEVTAPNLPDLTPRIPETSAPGSKLSQTESTRKVASSTQELWAAAALLTLSGQDQDGARYRNDVGFSAMDTNIGNSLAKQLSRGLTPKQWDLATQLCAKYWRQVGRCPK